MELRKDMLSVLRPLGGEEEVQAIRESIESGWWTRGPKVEQFEKEFGRPSVFASSTKVPRS